MKRNLPLMYAIALLQGMVFYAPVATLYRQVHGLSMFQITLIESISLALCILLEVPWGALADRMGYKRTMVFCCCLYFVSKLVFWQADGFGWFLAERVMLSVVIAGLSGVDTSVLYLSCPAGESQRVFGLYSSLQTLGLLLSAMVFSLWIKDQYQLAGLLFVLSMLACLALALTRSAALSVAGVLAFRVGNSLFQPLQLELQNRQISGEDRATALSAGAMIMDGVGVGANLAFGAAADFSLPAAFLLGGALCGMGLLLFLLWGEQKKTDGCC